MASALKSFVRRGSGGGGSYIGLLMATFTAFYMFNSISKSVYLLGSLAS